MPTRRTVLRACGAVAGTGLAGSSAGCLAALEDRLGGGPDARYAGWLHRPSLEDAYGAAGDVQTHSSFHYSMPAEVLAHEDLLTSSENYDGEALERDYAMTHGYGPVEAKDVEEYVRCSTGSVGDDGPGAISVVGPLAGDYDAESYAETAREDAVAADYESYTLLFNESVNTAVAVGNDHILGAAPAPLVAEPAADRPWRDRLEAVLTAAIDTIEGRRDGWVDRDDDVATLVDAMPGDRNVYGGPLRPDLEPPVDGVVAQGRSGAVADGELRVHWTLVFADEESADEGAVEDYYARGESTVLSTTREGRTVTVTEGDVHPLTWL